MFLTEERRLDVGGWLITFTTYASWLPGDPRGSVDRRHNVPGQPHGLWDRWQESKNARRLREPPFELGAKERAVVEAAIREVCAHRNWYLAAVNVRTKHLHVVALGDVDGDRMMNDFKAYATRRLVEAGLAPKGRSIWTRGGSKRLIRTIQDLERACCYVEDEQGADLHHPDVGLRHESLMDAVTSDKQRTM